MLKTILVTLALIPTSWTLGEVVEWDDLYSDLISMNSITGEKADYEEREVDGFKFYLDLVELDEQNETIEAMYEHLKGSLIYMKHRFPLRVMEKLREEGVKVIIKDDCGTEDEKESEDCKDNCPHACYVPEWSYRWDDDAFQHKAVMVRDLAGALRSAHGSPGLMIHEFAHAFHDLLIGFDNQDIKDAYQKAYDSGQYHAVNHVWTGFHADDEKVEAYSMTNEKEFFAEISEALWLRNNEEPFTFHDVFVDETLTDTRDDGQRINPVWSAWWSFSGPHGETPWYYQNLDLDEDENNSQDHMLEQDLPAHTLE